MSENDNRAPAVLVVKGDQIGTSCLNVIAPLERVNADALRVRVELLRKGDTVFDAHGGRHKVASVRTLKDGVISFKREDLSYREYLYPGGDIVIVPEHGWTFDGAGYRNLGAVDAHPRGEFYETCRCGETFGSGADGDESVADQRLREHADEANGRVIYCG